MSEIIDAQAQALATEATSIRSRATSVIVRSPREFELAAAERGRIKTKYKEVEAKRVYLKELPLEQCNRIDEFFRGPLQFLKDADTAIEKAMLGYQAEERRIAAEEQRRLEQEARAAREALEAKARAEREAADREAAELRRKEEEARASGDLSTAVSMRHQANCLVEASEEKAVAILESAETIVAKKVVPEIPIIKGLSNRTTWKARIVNVDVLPREYMLPNEKMLDAIAKTQKQAAKVPGVEFYTDQSMPQRA